MNSQNSEHWTRETFVPQKGRLTRLVGTILHARMPECFVGEQCEIRNTISNTVSMAEVVGFHDGEALLTLLGDAQGVSSRSAVVGTGRPTEIAVNEELLGRVIGPFGKPLDGDRPIKQDTQRPLLAAPPNPMKRNPIIETFVTGVRAIDCVLTCGVGQRIGIFGSAGTGKSTLILDLIGKSKADVVVVGMVGERGREVREFVDMAAANNSFSRTVLVVSTSDAPALERLRAADTATTIAEFFRDLGKNVLLVIDSITRVARAQREVGLAAGEPPTRRGFPPSVFSMLPALVERTGNSDVGSITAFYTVLVEGDDDNNDPVADEVRGLLDGHVILSRAIAARGHFPAIDVAASVSRLMNAIVSDEHKSLAIEIRSQLDRINEVDLLVKVGEYKAGADPEVDRALQNKQKLIGLLHPGRVLDEDESDIVEAMRQAIA